MYIKYKCLSDRFLEGVSVHLHVVCRAPDFLSSALIAYSVHIVAFTVAEAF